MRAFVRSSTAIIAVCWCASLVEGSISPRNEATERKARPRLELPKHVKATANRLQYQMTKDTEIRLDGRPCPYDRIPGDASIVHMEVVAGNPPTILAIHFKSKK